MAYDIGPRIGIEGEAAFRDSIRNINTTLKTLATEMQAVNSQFDKNDKSQEALTAQNQVLNKQIDAQKQKISELQKGLAAAAEKYGENDKVTQGWQQSVNKATADLNKMESELLSNNEAIKNYGKAQLEAVKNSEEFKAAQEKLGSMIDAVKKAAIAAGTAVVGLMAGGAKAAIEYESAFAGVRKTVDATEEEFAQLNQGIRDMSKNMPQSATDIAAVAEAAGQLGIQTDNILGFTKTMVMLGDATNMSSDEAATSLARLANITQMPQSEFDKLGSTIVALGNNLATTESEIVAMGLRLAGAGKQIGLSEAQILSFAGALSSVGIEAEAGGSAFSRVMVDMQLAVETNSEKLNDFAQVAGMTASEFAKAFKEDAAGALIAFITGLGDAESKGTSAIKVLDDMGITEIRLRDALLRASGAGDLFSDSIKLGTEAWQENVALTNEAEQRYATTESQINMLKNTIKDIGIQIGEKLLPTIKDMTQRLKEVDTKPIVDGFTWVINNAGNIATAAAAIGAAMLTWKVYSTIFTLAKAILAYKEALVVAKVAQQGLNIAMKANVIGLIITAVAALVAGIIVLWNTNEDFRNAVIGAWGAIKAAGQAVWDWLTTFFTETIPAVITSAKEWFAQLPTSISEAFTNAWTAISDWGASVLVWVADAIPKVIESVSRFFSTLPEKIGYALGFALGKITKWGVETYDWAKKQIPIIIDNVVTIFSELPGKIGQALTNALNTITQWGSNTLSWVKINVPIIINNITTFFSSLPGKIADSFGKVLSGISTWAVDATNKVKTEVPKITGQLVDFFSKLPGKMMEIGANIIKGLWEGIKNSTGWLWDRLNDFADGVIKGFKDAFDIHSPSRIMQDQVGLMIGAGVAEGIDNSIKRVSAAMSGLNNAVALDTNMNTGIQGRGAVARGANSPMTIGALLHVDHLTIANDMDIQETANRLGFLYNQIVAAKGGV